MIIALLKFFQRLRKKSNFPTFDEPPAVEAVDIVLEFIKDYKIWNDFAFAEQEKSARSILAERSYDALVRKYCGSGKEHQFLTFSNDSSFAPDTDAIVDVETATDKVVVKVKHGHRGWDECFYEFELHRRSGLWALDEVYYLDEFENNTRLKLL